MARRLLPGTCPGAVLIRDLRVRLGTRAGCQPDRAERSPLFLRELRTRSAAPRFPLPQALEGARLGCLPEEQLRQQSSPAKKDGRADRTTERGHGSSTRCILEW